jgi:hypothetical protein
MVDGEYANMNRGKLAIGVIFGVGLVLATVAVTFHFRQGRRCIERFGAPVANLIRHAPRVELLTLRANPIAAEHGETTVSKSPAGETPDRETSGADSISIDGASWPLQSRLDVTSRMGLVHARHALIMDGTYDWSRNVEGITPEWSAGLVFANGDRQTSVFFDFEQRVVLVTPGKILVSLTPTAAEAIEVFQQRMRER